MNIDRNTRNWSGTSNNIDYEAYKLILMTSGGHWTNHEVQLMGGRKCECHPRIFAPTGNPSKFIVGANSRARIYFDT